MEISKKKKIIFVSILILILLIAIVSCSAINHTNNKQEKDISDKTNEKLSPNDKSNNKNKSDKADKDQEESSKIDENNANENSALNSDDKQNTATDTNKATTPNSEQTIKPSTNTNTSKPSQKPSAHTHSWVEQFKTVYHDEKGHYENVMVKDKWVEYKPIYEAQVHDICTICGLDLTANNAVPWQHAKEHMLNGEASGHHTKTVKVEVGKETIEHPAVYEKKWIVDENAWNEQVSQGFWCSICKEWKH